MLKVIFQADKPEKNFQGGKSKQKVQVCLEIRNRADLKQKRLFKSGTSLKSLNPAYKAKCDSLFIICGKPEIFKDIALKNRTGPAQNFSKGEK